MIGVAISGVNIRFLLPISQTLRHLLWIFDLVVRDQVDQDQFNRHVDQESLRTGGGAAAPVVRRRGELKSGDIETLALSDPALWVEGVRIRLLKVQTVLQRGEVDG